MYHNPNDLRHDDANVREALASGASGFLLKDVPAAQLVAAIRAAATGDASLVWVTDEDSRMVGLGYWRRYARPTHRPHADLERVAVAVDQGDPGALDGMHPANGEHWPGARPGGAGPQRHPGDRTARGSRARSQRAAHRVAAVRLGDLAMAAGAGRVADVPDSWAGVEVGGAGVDVARAGAGAVRRGGGP